MKHLIRPTAVLILYIIFALYLIDLIMGVDVINPTNTTWMFEGGDWSQHQLGWEFFRNSDWSFPLTAIDGFFYPIGANIGYTDSIPLLAFFFKLFDPILPAEFQYFGPLIFINFTLQGLFAYRIARNFSFSFLSSILWGLLLMLTPPLIHRLGHTALTTHWLFLYVWYQYQIKATAPRTFIPVLISLLIHPYLTVMIIISKLFDWLRLPPIKLIRNITIAGILSLSIWWMLGYFSTPGDQLFGDVGYYDTFILGFIFGPPEMTTILDRFLTYPVLRSDAASEGSAYLGLGIISATFITLSSLRKPNHQKRIPYYILSYSFLLLSIAIFASRLGQIKYRLAEFPLMTSLMSSFRTNGRFLWIIWYFIVFFTIKYFPRTKLTLPLLLLFFGMQYLDIEPLLDFSMRPEARIYSQEIYSTIEKTLPLSSTQTIAIYPPYRREIHFVEDYVLFSLVAARNKKNITAGYLARHDKTKAAQVENQYLSDLYTSTLDPNTVYVSSRHFDKPLLHAYDQNPDKTSGICFGSYRAITPVTP